MSEKRSTPLSKMSQRGPPSASKFRTPVNMNSTVLERRDSASKLGGRSHSVLDSTGIGNSIVCPSIKSTFTHRVDNDLDCHLAYANYLQSFLKAEAVEKIVQKHEEDLSDQLITQKDKLYKSKLKCRQIKKELTDLKTLESIDQLLNIMEENISSFNSSIQESNLENTLQQLLEVLNIACNRLNVRNIELIEDEKSFENFLLILKKCEKGLEKMKSLNLNMELICELGNLIEKYKKNMEILREKERNTMELQKNATFVLMKSISDMYAKKE